MRVRSKILWRWISGWLIAALLFAQHGALGHALAHLDGDIAAAAVVSAQSGTGAAHDLACAKCLAYVALDHAAAAAPVVPPLEAGHAAQVPDQPVFSLAGTVPAACSRDPPRQFS